MQQSCMTCLPKKDRKERKKRKKTNSCKLKNIRKEKIRKPQRIIYQIRDTRKYSISTGKENDFGSEILLLEIGIIFVFGYTFLTKSISEIQRNKQKKEVKLTDGLAATWVQIVKMWTTLATSVALSQDIAG